MSINVFSREGLKAWLVRQDPEIEYEYASNGDCLICRYFRAQGVPVSSMGAWTWSDENNKSHQIPTGLNDIAEGNGGPHNYGAALARIEAPLP